MALKGALRMRNVNRRLWTAISNPRSAALKESYSCTVWRTRAI